MINSNTAAVADLILSASSLKKGKTHLSHETRYWWICVNVE